MSFDNLIEENYKGFGQGSNLDLVDLRLMYYGRIGVYVAFTDDGEYETKTSSYEMDRPDGVICHQVNDVVGRKVKSSAFYMNILRIQSNASILDVSNYRINQFWKDVDTLRDMDVELDILNFYVDEVVGDTKLRSPFDRIWALTEHLARMKSDYGREWQSILMYLGYDAVEDLRGSGVITLGREPVTLVLYHDRVITDIDILHAQLHRTDPRKRTSDMVARKLKTLKNERNRIAKKSPSRDSNVSDFKKSIRQSLSALGAII